MIDRKPAMDMASCFLRASIPDAAVEQVWATLYKGKWLISFGKVMPPGVVESPGGWCVTVDAKTGRIAWLPTL